MCLSPSYKKSRYSPFTLKTERQTLTIMSRLPVTTIFVKGAIVKKKRKKKNWTAVMPREMCCARLWPELKPVNQLRIHSALSPLSSHPSASFKWPIPFLPLVKDVHAHTNAPPHATTAPPTQLLSREHTDPSNSKRVSAQAFRKENPGESRGEMNG